MSKLAEREMVEADNGYRGQYDKIRTPVDFNTEAERLQQVLARARHETINRKFKQFGALKQIFRHERPKHQTVFRAVVTVIQLGIHHGANIAFNVEFN